MFTSDSIAVVRRVTDWQLEASLQWRRILLEAFSLRLNIELDFFVQIRPNDDRPHQANVYRLVTPTWGKKNFNQLNSSPLLHRYFPSWVFEDCSHWRTSFSRMKVKVGYESLLRTNKYTSFCVPVLSNHFHRILFVSGRTSQPFITACFSFYFSFYESLRECRCKVS